MNHIERMEVELKELKEKIEKAKDFMEKELEEAKFTSEMQRLHLHEQLVHMWCYAGALEKRIKYDKDKIKGGTND